ncbi:NHL repeat-containing protein [Humisphaera borealis]|uniref:6-bladed beta-propeller n=1 Tax=Humisphaera borealis TaxID=2807512 RepID=A0A7M2WV21_9BACT|nr:hypothetical protein [Humisphaera borealis]QOV88681.1 6-bladed beta-propeller [Humisphaera borealis]
MNEPKPSRRTLLKHAGLGAAASLLGAPMVIADSKTKPPLQDAIIGHGGFRYRVDLTWSQADPAKTPVNDCHEMVQVADGRLFLLTNQPKNNVLIYDKSGKVLETWTLGFKGAHGLSLHKDAAGKEHLWVTDTSTGQVVKTTLAGQILLELPTATKCGAYAEHTPYSPTETAVGPNGDIYVADGYGSQYILRFDAAGKFVSKFGGKSAIASNAGKFLQAHGVALDTRGADPLLVCTERLRNEFHWFTLEGKFVRSVYLPGAFVSRPVIAGKNLYSGVCFGMKPNDFRMWKDRGFVVVLDEKDQLVSAPGGRPPKYADGALEVLLQDQPVFRNAHDVCVDDQGDLYVAQWAADKVYPYKLHRVG